MALKKELREAADQVEEAEGLWAKYKVAILVIAGVSFVLGFVVGLMF